MKVKSVTIKSAQETVVLKGREIDQFKVSLMGDVSNDATPENIRAASKQMLEMLAKGGDVVWPPQ